MENLMVIEKMMEKVKDFEMNLEKDLVNLKKIQN
jgi:hypothetical protein